MKWSLSQIMFMFPKPQETCKETFLLHTQMLLPFWTEKHALRREKERKTMEKTVHKRKK
jgi:hypothetical protein